MNISNNVLRYTLLKADLGVAAWISNFKLLELLPLCLSENGDTLLLANVVYDEAFIYNRIYNKLEKIGITNNICGRMPRIMLKA